MGRRQAERVRGVPDGASGAIGSGGSLFITDESERQDVVVWTTGVSAVAPLPLPTFGAAPCALKAAASPLLAAAREALSAPAGPERDAQSAVLVAALRGLRDAWRALERRVGAAGSGAGETLDGWIAALDRAAPQEPEEECEDVDRDDAAPAVPERWRPLCDVWDEATLAPVLAEPESAAREWAAQALVECPAHGPWTLDLSEAALYALALPADVRAAVLGKLAAAEGAAGEALALLDPEAQPSDVCRRVAAFVAELGE